MRTVGAIVALMLLPSLAHADRCRAHCRDVARACKLRCKANHPEGASAGGEKFRRQFPGEKPMVCSAGGTTSEFLRSKNSGVIRSSL